MQNQQNISFQSIEREMHLAGTLAERAAMLLELGNKNQQKDRQIEAMAKQIEELTKTASLREQQIQDLTAQLAELKTEKTTKEKAKG